MPMDLLPFYASCAVDYATKMCYSTLQTLYKSRGENLRTYEFGDMISQDKVRVPFFIANLYSCPTKFPVHAVVNLLLYGPGNVTIAESI